MNLANFNLCSWASNITQLQSLAKQDGSARAKTGNIVKILGLQWNTSSDSSHLFQVCLSS